MQVQIQIENRAPSNLFDVVTYCMLKLLTTGTTLLMLETTHHMIQSVNRMHKQDCIRFNGNQTLANTFKNAVTDVNNIASILVVKEVTTCQ